MRHCQGDGVEELHQVVDSALGKAVGRGRGRGGMEREGGGVGKYAGRGGGLKGGQGADREQTSTQEAFRCCQGDGADKLH